MQMKVTVKEYMNANRCETIKTPISYSLWTEQIYPFVDFQLKYTLENAYPYIECKIGKE